MERAEKRGDASRISKSEIVLKATPPHPMENAFATMS